MNPEIVQAARWTGLLHDLGKYRKEFQEYFRGERTRSIEMQHAGYGAALAISRKWLRPAFAIAGHHAGLHCRPNLRELIGNFLYRISDCRAELTVRFEKEVFAIPQKIEEPKFLNGKPVSAEFYIRMLFSALVDADFLDTKTITGADHSENHSSFVRHG